MNVRLHLMDTTVMLQLLLIGAHLAIQKSTTYYYYYYSFNMNGLKLAWTSLRKLRDKGTIHVNTPSKALITRCWR